nr:peptidylprolyl isomerase [Ruminococcus sp.]
MSLAKPQKSDKKKAWIVISAVAVFLVAVIVVFVITSNKSNGSAGATNDSASASNVSATIGESQSKGTHHAEIDIKDYGVIKVELNGDVAPITVANFINLANSHFYDGLTFHRIIDGFMMQGGDPLGNGTGGSENTIKGEFSQNGVENNLSHTRGAISMARSTDMDSASSQFFIVQSDSTYLDGQYACFGYVTDGMDIVDEICKNAVTTDSNGSVSAENQPVINSITITD